METERLTALLQYKNGVVTVLVAIKWWIIRNNNAAVITYKLYPAVSKRHPKANWFCRENAKQ
jgi:hypothetical protein